MSEIKIAIRARRCPAVSEDTGNPCIRFIPADWDVEHPGGHIFAPEDYDPTAEGMAWAEEVTSDAYCPERHPTGGRCVFAAGHHGIRHRLRDGREWKTKIEPNGGPWLISFTCCGRDTGSAVRQTWREADELRQSYVAAPDHQRSAIVSGLLPAAAIAGVAVPTHTHPGMVEHNAARL